VSDPRSWYFRENSGLLSKSTSAVGFGVEVPLFQGDRVVKEVQEARAGRKKLGQQYAALRDGVSLDAWKPRT
jgi:outer membrane protein TolC